MHSAIVQVSRVGALISLIDGVTRIVSAIMADRELGDLALSSAFMEGSSHPKPPGLSCLAIGTKP